MSKCEAEDKRRREEKEKQRFRDIEEQEARIRLMNAQAAALEQIKGGGEQEKCPQCGSTRFARDMNSTRICELCRCQWHQVKGW